MEKTILITNVNYDASKKHIDTVAAVVFPVGKAPFVEKMSREDAYGYATDKGFKILTLIPAKDGTVSCAAVLAYEQGGTKVLRTKGNETGDDNLASLPAINW